MKHLFSLNTLIVKYKDKLLWGILFITLSNLFRIFQPQIIRVALDKIVAYIKASPESKESANLSSDLMYFGLMVLGCALLMGIFMYFMRQTIIVMSRLIEYDLRKKIFDHYLKLDLAFYKNNKTGDIMSRISEDVNKVRMYLGPAFLYGFNLISLFVVVIITMFQVNFWLSVYTLLPLPVLSLIIYKVSNLIHQRSGKIQAQLAVITSIAQEAFSGIRIIKSFHKEKDWIKKFDQESQGYSDLSMNLAKVDAMFFPSMFLLIGISTLITIYVGGLDVYNGTVSAGNIAEFVIYINMLTWPVSAIGWCASIIQQAEASQKRINEFLKTEPEISSEKQHREIFDHYDIRLDHLFFSYQEQAEPSLKNISLDIKEGAHVAIVGRTGSGKSTLAELLLRMADPQSGQISIGNLPLKDWNLSQLRSSISYVPQDVFLFSDSIRNNLKFGLEEGNDITDENLMSILETVGMDQEVRKFPEGLDTLLGERGITLSGGQRQRLGIARTYVRNTPIHIFDDCLSAVDAGTEEKIIGNLHRRFKGKTMILITHRISQTRDMDQIYVLDMGELKEQGSYDQLLERNGIFTKMYLLETTIKKEQMDEVI
ncbi:MAG: ABC transporter ATP-binding protein [Saprospiraceae bacterium]|nr:ABC transporter ATP-binding protein [Saprospiraceae bacterium]